MKAMRGFFGDPVIMLLFMFAIALVFVVLAYAAGLLATSGNSTLNLHAQNALSGLLSFNTIAPLFVVATGIALMGSALLIRTNPAFFAVFFIVQVVFAIVAIGLSNAWDSIFTGSVMASTASIFTQWTVVFRYFPFISIGLSIIFAIAVFAKGE